MNGTNVCTHSYHNNHRLLRSTARGLQGAKGEQGVLAETRGTLHTPCSHLRCNAVPTHKAQLLRCLPIRRLLLLSVLLYYNNTVLLYYSNCTIIILLIQL